MPRTPESLQPEQQTSEPELLRFISLKPDEQLRISKVKPTKTNPAMIELIKLETPLGTDDVGLSGYKLVTKDAIDEAAAYLNGVSLVGISEVSKRRFGELRKQIHLIQAKLR